MLIMDASPKEALCDEELELQVIRPQDCISRVVDHAHVADAWRCDRSKKARRWTVGVRPGGLNRLLKLPELCVKPGRSFIPLNPVAGTIIAFRKLSFTLDTVYARVLSFRWNAAGTPCLSDDSRWNTCNDRVVWNVPGDDSAGSNERAFADRDAGDDGGVAADRCCALHAGDFNLPVGLSLKAAVGIGRARMAVVGEHDAMTDEDFVFDDHAFTDESVRRDLATRTDRGVLLDLDKGSDLRVAADRATVQIHQ